MSERYNKLTATQKKILDTLTDGPKSVKEIAKRAGVSIGSVYRPVRELTDSQWIEIDNDATAFSREKYFKIKRSPNTGIEIIINSGGEQQSVSFNLFLEKVAAGAEMGSVPKIAKSWPRLQKAIAYLAIFAAEEMENPQGVTEVQLLEVKSMLQGYMDVLKEQFALGMQILNNEDFWDPNSLKIGTMRKTDRYFTPDEMRKHGKMILAQFQRAENDGTEGASTILEGEILR